MLKFILSITLVVISFTAFAADLTIYTYSSFNSKWGPGPQVFPLFEKKCSCKLKIVALEDTGQLLTRALLEKERPKADILLGLNDTHLAKLKELDIFASYTGQHYQKLAKKLQLDKKQRFIPFDYGHLAFIYDSKKIKNPPKSLEDLTHKRFKDSIVIESASTSAPGLSFLYWTLQAYTEDDFLNYWQRLSDNILSITSNWSSAYGMFTKGETPIVLSYVTSAAYHLTEDANTRYRAAIFAEGHYPQIEFATILQSTKNPALAQSFIDFMLSESFQNIIPTANWMYPAISYQDLPEAFITSSPVKTLPLLQEAKPQKTKQWLKLWSAQIRKRK